MGLAEEQEQTLTEIGLSKNEAKAYLALLTLGESTAGEVTDKSKMHRPNAYDALDRLIEKGLVSYHLKDKTKIFKAADPENLHRLLREKEMRLEKITPQLELAKQLSNSSKTVAEVYEGMKSFRRLLEDFLNYQKTIYVYGIPKMVPELVASWINSFHNRRIEKRIVMKHIYNEDAKDRIKYLNSLNYTEAAYLPEEFSSPVTTFVCGDEVLITTWKPMVTVRIVNAQLAESYTKYAKLILANTRKK